MSPIQNSIKDSRNYVPRAKFVVDSSIVRTLVRFVSCFALWFWIDSSTKGHGEKWPGHPHAEGVVRYLSLMLATKAELYFCAVSA